MSEKRKRRCVSAELSLWALSARSCFYKILAVLVLMAAAECAMFCRALYGYTGGDVPGFERLIDESGMSVIFLAALGVIFIILVGMEWMQEKKSCYTLMRLRVTELHFVLTELVVNVLFVTVLFAVQVGVVLGMARLYTETVGAEQVMPQFLFLAFYSDPFLHCLLPMADTGKWVRNALMLLALCGAAANGGRGNNYAMPVVLFVTTAGYFVSGIGAFRDIVCIIVFVMGIAAEIWFTIQAISGRYEE